RPATTLPAIVAVLKRIELRANWPDAIRVLEKIRAPGAGKALLELATSTNDVQQRIAALTALARVIDPPSETLIRLLPLVLSDGPFLASALVAAGHAVSVHHQHDFVARRGLEWKLSAAVQQQLEKLPARLNALIAAADKSGKQAEVKHAARVLAMRTQLLNPQPLKGIQIVSFSAESEQSPAKSVVDGIWNSIEARTQWKYPLGPRDSIILDLGSERTVTGVRIWNLNEPSGTLRGWKEVEVFTGKETSSLVKSSAGVLVPAPGAAETPDYSSTIPLPFVRCRYIRIRAVSLWSRNSHTGLSEIQVLGF
ncbi:MAG: DUF4457 domain-containing protein, partial [Planctomycetes bacterium]|nr:DUF4457 domain-containing protein [Planctomycetota bacterium]